MLRIADSEPRRLADGTTVLGRGDAPWSNRLTGRAHGVEAILRRDAPDSLSGWIAYAYSATSLRRCGDGRDGFRATTISVTPCRPTRSTACRTARALARSFVTAATIRLQAMLDSSHSRRMLPRCSTASRPLFFGLTDRRNTLRLPAYARLDVRADRAVWT